MSIYKKFSSSLKWNTIEALIYKFLLVGHQVMLFRATAPATYGLIGTLFASVFLLVAIANLGLDNTIGPFFMRITASKKKFKDFSQAHFLPNFLLIGLICLSAGLFLPSTVPSSIVVLLALLTFSEAMKKTLRILLQNAFLAKKTTLIELATISSYVGLVWGGHLSGLPISLPLIFIPMLITSLASCLVLIFFTYQFYSQLPDQIIEESQIKKTSMIKTRGLTWLHDLSHLIFSGNFLIPLFAFRFGLAQAGLLKFIGNICYGITTIIQKIFGFSGGALLANLKHEKLAARQAAFITITNKVHHVLFGAVVFLSINYKKLLNLNTTASTADYQFFLILLFITLMLSESFFISYEKLYLNEERSDLLLLFNLVPILLLAALNVFALLPPLLLLSSLVSIRVVSFSCIRLASWYQWHMRPSLKIEPLYLVGALAFSIGFFFVLP